MVLMARFELASKGRRPLRIDRATLHQRIDESGRARTCDHLINSQVLPPTELRIHFECKNMGAIKLSSS